MRYAQTRAQKFPDSVSQAARWLGADHNVQELLEQSGSDLPAPRAEGCVSLDSNRKIVFVVWDSVQSLFHTRRLVELNLSSIMLCLCIFREHLVVTVSSESLLENSARRVMR